MLTRLDLPVRCIWVGYILFIKESYIRGTNTSSSLEDPISGPIKKAENEATLLRIPHRRCVWLSGSRPYKLGEYSDCFDSIYLAL